MTQTLLPVLEPPTTTKSIYLQISATQLDTFAGSRESCNRKWYLGYVIKLPTIQNKSANFGSRLHEVLERWFKADDHGTVADLYPAGWNEGLTLLEEDLVRRLVSLGLEAGLLAREPDREIESKFFFNLIDEPATDSRPALKVDIVGYRDLISRSKWVVTDHKSTGSGDYAKTDYTLPRTTQMPVYGISMVVEAMARGEQVPDEVFVEHNIFCTAQGKAEKREGREPRVWKVGPVPIPVKGRRNPSFVWKDGARTICGECVDGEEAPSIRETTNEKQRCGLCGAQALVEDDSTPSLEEQLEVFLARARAMAEVKQIQGWQNVRGPLNVQAACNAFGGCPYARLCEGRESEKDYRHRIGLVQAELEKQAQPQKAATEQPAVAPQPVAVVASITPASSTPVVSLKEHRSMSIAMLRRNKPAINGATPPTPTPTPSAQVVQGIMNGQPATFTPNGPVGPGYGPEGSLGFPAKAPTPSLSALLAVGNTGATPVLVAQPPQVNPNPVPPPPVLTRSNPNQPIMPWAVQGCKACQDGPVSHGVASNGRPCVVCDGLAEQDQKPTAPRWYDWKFENGVLSASPKVGSQAPPVGVEIGSGAHRMNQTISIVATTGLTGALTITPGTADSKATTDLLAVGQPASASTSPPKKRGRPRKEASVAPTATTTTVTTPSAVTITTMPPAESLDTEEGFTLCIGCRPLRREITLFDDIWTELTSGYAKGQGVASFYALKPFERTDRIVENVSKIAETLVGQTIYVPAQRSQEQTNFVTALRALASEVYEA